MTHADQIKSLVMNLKYSLTNAQNKSEIDLITTKINKYLPEMEKIRSQVHFRDVDAVQIVPSDNELTRIKKMTETNIYLINVGITTLKREIGSLLARSAAEDLNVVVQYVKIIREMEAL